MIFDVRASGQAMTFVTRVCRPALSREEVFIINTWTRRQRFAEIEAEVRRALDSFRLLGQGD